MSALPSQVEVLVVGAGAAGSVYAARLAQAGRKVLVLESGPAWEVGDLVSSQIWGRRLKWSGPVLQQPPGPQAFAHRHATGRGFGGAAVHHFGTWLRLRPSDRVGVAVRRFHDVVSPDLHSGQFPPIQIAGQFAPSNKRGMNPFEG